MHLDRPQLVNAFGILLNLMAGSFQSILDGVHSFKLPGAMSAYHAILSVQLSERGFTGVKDPLMSPRAILPSTARPPTLRICLPILGRSSMSRDSISSTHLATATITLLSVLGDPEKVYLQHERYQGHHV